MTGIKKNTKTFCRDTGRRVTKAEMIPAVMVTAGLALYVEVGAPSGTTSHVSHLAWALAAAFVISAAGTAVGLGRRTREPGRRAMYYGLATGVVYSLTAVLTKATVDRLTPSVLPILGHWQLYALLLASVVGLVLNQSAFQAGHVAASLPAMSVVNPVLASLMGVVLFGEHLDAQRCARLVRGGRRDRRDGRRHPVAVALAAGDRRGRHVPALEV